MAQPPYYVRSKIKLKALVCILTDKSNPAKVHLGREDREHQWWNKHECIADNIDYNEWMWRWETAIAILCAGYADTTGYYLGDVLGGEFVPPVD
jgi:hypothetical protein